ncbi:MAG: 30S ribosomal protein S3 [Candidatus Omnitrophica bacterium]|nr:30S ribosomal protein S3 [Candidatus Omnitrophota bacterium]
MGQKVNPICLRIGLHRTWNSRWFAPSKQQFRAYIAEDLAIRDMLHEELASAAVSRVEIERSPDRVRIAIHTARPGVLIGRRGENIQRLQETVQQIIGTQKQLKMDYLEITNPSIEAQLIADSITFQLAKRVAHRRAMKRAMQQAMEAGGKGIKVICAGRLGGSEMKRQETYRLGKVPLGTFRSDIDYGASTAHTTAGCIGVKVWVYRGDIIPMKPQAEDRPSIPSAVVG